MSISTLVIGIGGTGVITLRALKKNYLDLAPKEEESDERVPASFLAFDFDRSALLAGDEHDRFAPLEEKEFFYLNPNHIQDLLRNLDRGKDGELAWDKVLRWFPDRAHIQIPASEVEANGASQLRALGRLGFILNDEIIETAIRQHLCSLRTEINVERLSQDRRIILISSLAGGTGAGMMIDMAYVARRQEGRPRVFAYLLLPEVFQDVDSGGRIFQNSYAFLKELAYLKDQQIPFQGDYYKIPSVDVPPGGEEPFARLFLFTGNGCSGSTAIREACLQMAQTILAQLHSKIQEKTLAVVSNTLSSSSDGERIRRRTHCFSTSGSHYLELLPIESVRELVFQTVVEAMRNPAELEKTFADEVSWRLEQAKKRLGGQLAAPTEATPPVRTEGGEAAVDDERARQVSDQFRSHISAQADTGKDQIIRKLIESLDAICDQARTPRGALTARESLGKKKDLILADFDDKHYEQNLRALKEVSDFAAVDGNLQAKVRDTLGVLDIALGLGEAIGGRLFYEKLKKWRIDRWIRFGEPSSPEIQAVRTEWEKREQRLDKLAKLNTLVRYGEKKQDAIQHTLWGCDALKKALQEKTFQENLRSILIARAFRVLNQEIDEALNTIDRRLQDPAAVWRDLPVIAATDRRTDELPKEIGAAAQTLIRDHLVSILEEGQREVQSAELPVVRRQKLFAIVQRWVDRDPRLRKVRFAIAGDAEEKILNALVRTRQRVFERRTPNPQRKGFTVILLPEGIYWHEGGREKFRSFLEASAVQILNTRCQVEDYSGSRIWIYYEDLFNPPEHIRNLDEYFRTYDSQKYRELFHIDRRMLEYSAFRDVNSMTSTLVVTCGNDGCRENIAAVPRAQRTCPKCHRLIRSRCGNERCTENTLHQNTQGRAKSCPGCEQFNHAAWWRCDEHGKTPVEIPIDKERCPRCIAEHLDDPVGFPAKRVSVRPDLLESVPCPRCQDLQEADPKYQVFRIGQDLLPFYRNGVNGHERGEFLRLAELYKLPDKFRCPRCRTHLIPVHHDKGTPGYRRRVEL
jgi:hypothetical protein